jgi:hypothetical protein
MTEGWIDEKGEFITLLGNAIRIYINSLMIMIENDSL